MHIVEDDLSGDQIRGLLECHFAGMLANSPLGSCHFLDIEGLKAADVTFWSIWDGENLAGMGALKQHDHCLGEVKSMRTADAFRGRGVGAAMLAHIIAVARSRALARLSLETGSSPAFDAAHALYARSGFVYCAPFGDYRPDPFSRFMTMEL